MNDENNATAETIPETVDEITGTTENQPTGKTRGRKSRFTPAEQDLIIGEVRTARESGTRGAIAEVLRAHGVKPATLFQWEKARRGGGSKPAKAPRAPASARKTGRKAGRPRKAKADVFDRAIEARTNPHPIAVTHTLNEAEQAGADLAIRNILCFGPESRQRIAAHIMNRLR